MKKQKTYTAYYTSDLGDKRVRTSKDFGGYERKSDFVRDLRHNGYTVHRCEISDVYDFVVASDCIDDNLVWQAARLAFREGRLQEFRTPNDEAFKNEYIRRAGDADFNRSMKRFDRKLTEIETCKGELESKMENIRSMANA